MANYGLGVGSFLTGLTQGVKMRGILDKDQRDQEEHEIDLKAKQFNLKSAEETAARQRGEWSYQDQQRAIAEQKRLANEPVESAERQSKLNKLNDESELRSASRDAYDASSKKYNELRARSILTTTDAEGKKHIKVEGEEVADEERANKLFEQKHGSMSRFFIEDPSGLAAYRNAFIRQGKIAEADAFDKFMREKGVQKAMDDYGLGLQAASVKDWQGASKALNRVVTNGEYVSTDNHKVTFEPIYSNTEVAEQNKIDPSVKKYNGIRVVYEDKDGNRSVKEYTDNQTFFNEMQTILHPYSIFNIEKAQYDAKIAAQAKADQKATELSNNIILDKVKSNLKINEREFDSHLKIIEERAKSMNLDPDKISRDAIQILEQDAASGNRLLGTPEKDAQGNPTGKIIPPTGEEAFDRAFYRAAEMHRAASGATEPQRMLRSRTVTPEAQPKKPFDPGIVRAM